MKIKTFNSFLNDAETAINKFLEDKTYIDLKTDTVVHNNKIFTQYTVVYEEKMDMLPEHLKGKDLENKNIGSSVYVREKGSKGEWQKVGGLLKEIGDSVQQSVGYAKGGISIPVSSNPKHHHPHWLDDDWRQSSEWPKEWARQVKRHKRMGRFE